MNGHNFSDNRLSLPALTKAQYRKWEATYIAGFGDAEAESLIQANRIDKGVSEPLSYRLPYHHIAGVD